MLCKIRSNILHILCGALPVTCGVWLLIGMLLHLHDVEISQIIIVQNFAVIFLYLNGMISYSCVPELLFSCFLIFFNSHHSFNEFFG